MLSDKLRLLAKTANFFISYSVTLPYQRILALQHRWTYKAVPSAKNVVARRLNETLPTGYKVILDCD